MAEHVYKTYSCDRCGANLGSNRPSRSQKAEVSASFHWSDGPGPVFVWKDLCNMCNDEVRLFFGI